MHGSTAEDTWPRSEPSSVPIVRALRPTLLAIPDSDTESDSRAGASLYGSGAWRNPYAHLNSHPAQTGAVRHPLTLGPPSAAEFRSILKSMPQIRESSVRR